MAEVTEVVTKFSFKGSLSPLGKYNKQLGSAIKGLGAFTAATNAALAGLGLWAGRILDSVDPIAQLNRETGISVENIQELSFASSVNGGSVEKMQASLKKLGAVVGEVAMGTGMGKLVFEEYGISVKDAEGKIKDGGVVFDELRQKIVELGLSKSQVQGIAKKLGLDPSTVQLLLKTNQEMDALRERTRELGVLTKEQIDATADYNDSLTTMHRGLDGLKREIAVGFAPQLQKLAEGFTDLIVANREWLVEGISGGIKAMAAFSKAVFNVLKPIGKVIAKIWEFKELRPIIVALGIAIAVAFSPITKTQIAIAALILLLEDLFTAFDGGESIIADFFSQFGIDLSKAGEKLDEFIEKNKILLNILTFGRFGRDFNAQPDAFTRVPEGAFGAVGNSTSNVDNRTVNQSIDVKVTAPDPQGAGIAVGESLQKQMNDVWAQAGNGGL